MAVEKNKENNIKKSPTKKSTPTKKVSTKSSTKKSTPTKKVGAKSPIKKSVVTKKIEKKEIDKIKLTKILLGAFLVLILCLICFFASSTNSKKYSKSTSSTEDTSSTDSDNEVLAEITKQAGEISDDERTSPNEISVDDYLDLYKSSTDSIILISKPTCQYCKLATPILENIIYETGVKINYINADNVSDDEKANLVASNSYFSEGYGTPLILVVGESSIKDKIEGLVTKEDYISFFTKYGFIS